MTLIEVHAEIAQHAGEIYRLFKAGAKVTILVRNPGLGKHGPHSADMIVSDDDMAAVQASVEYLRNRDEVKLDGAAHD